MWQWFNITLQFKRTWNKKQNRVCLQWFFNIRTLSLLALFCVYRLMLPHNCQCFTITVTIFAMEKTTIQSTAVIMRSNIVRYYVNNYRNWGRISIRCWVHKRHPILALTRYNGSTLYVIELKFVMVYRESLFIQETQLLQSHKVINPHNSGN